MHLEKALKDDFNKFDHIDFENEDDNQNQEDEEEEENFAQKKKEICEKIYATKLLEDTVKHSWYAELNRDYLV